jgi:hypothetical protein
VQARLRLHGFPTESHAHRYFAPDRFLLRQAEATGDVARELFGRITPLFMGIGCKMTPLPVSVRSDSLAERVGFELTGDFVADQ